MSQDDPFGDFGDGDRTVIRPSPGGRRAGTVVPGLEEQRAPRRAATRTAAPMDAGPVAPIADTGVNPLVAAAQSLMALIVRLRGSPAQSDVESLRERVVRELREFERRASQAGAAPEAVRSARYALCATIDDIVLNTPWGSHSGWAKQSMVSTFYKEAWGGERFFDILEQLHRDPGRSGDVLELMYLCLSLGFEGKLRVLPRGQSELGRIREGLFRSIRQRRGDVEKELSPRWRGIDAGHRPLSAQIPLWVVGAAAAAILTAAFMGLSYALNRSSDTAFAQLGALPPTGPVTIERIIAAPPPPPPPPPPEVVAQFERIKTFLAPEIAERLVEVFEDNQTITVRIKAPGLFASGSPTVAEGFLPLITRIGQALETEPGAVLIEGHSDNQPIRSLRFPSNWHLSMARAESVRDLIAAHLSAPGRLTAEGRADTEPIASNDTREGREQNRRIEVILVKAQG
jgi:type VI secretion system protein ImpK